MKRSGSIFSASGYKLSIHFGSNCNNQLMHLADLDIFRYIYYAL